MTKYLFIDTNIYLKFYHFSNDDLEELKKVVALLNNRKIKLFVPKQVKNEFYRNRDSKLADAIKQIKDSKPQMNLPTFCRAYSHYDEINKYVKNIEKEKDDLLKTLLDDIKNKQLKADNVIEKLFDIAQEIDYTPEIVSRSKFRYDLGNPPGKGNSYGDALNWECLLTIENSDCFNTEKYDLYFISDDQDYTSSIDKGVFNNFLSEEWNKQKGSKILFYKNLTEFFKENYSHIKSADDFERKLLVDKFVNSHSFYNTRYNLLALHDFGIGELSDEQIERILTASINNTQINWISQDDDINKMLYEIIDNYDNKIDVTLLNKFKTEIPRK